MCSRAPVVSVDNEQRRALALVDDGRERHAGDLARGRIAERDGGGHAETHVVAGLEDGEAGLIGAGRRVGTRRKLAQSGEIDTVRLRPQAHLGLALAEPADQRFRNGDDGLLLLQPRHAYRHLAGRDDLARLHGRGRDDAVGIGAQAGIGERVSGQRHGALGAQHAAVGLVGRRALLFEIGVGGPALLAQYLAALQLGLRLHLVALGGSQLRLRLVELEPEIDFIERGQDLTCLHRFANLDQAARHLAGDPEAEIAFDARAHRGDEAAFLDRRLIADLLCEDRTRRGRVLHFRLALGASRQRQCNDRKQKSERNA